MKFICIFAFAAFRLTKERPVHHTASAITRQNPLFTEYSRTGVVRFLILGVPANHRVCVPSRSRSGSVCKLRRTPTAPQSKPSKTQQTMAPKDDRDHAVARRPTSIRPQAQDSPLASASAASKRHIASVRSVLSARLMWTRSAAMRLAIGGRNHARLRTSDW